MATDGSELPQEEWQLSTGARDVQRNSSTVSRQHGMYELVFYKWPTHMFDSNIIFRVFVVQASSFLFASARIWV